MTKHPCTAYVHQRHQRVCGIFLFDMWDVNEHPNTPPSNYTIRFNGNGTLDGSSQTHITTWMDQMANAKLQVHPAVIVQITRDGDRVVDVHVTDHKTGASLAHMEGLGSPQQGFAFNDRAQGIFADDYIDRFGMPVRDTFAAQLRASIYGAPALQGDVKALTAKLIGSFSSQQLEQLDALIHARQPSVDDVPAERSVLEWMRQEAPGKWVDIMIESHEIDRHTVTAWVRENHQRDFADAPTLQQAAWIHEYTKTREHAAHAESDSTAASALSMA